MGEYLKEDHFKDIDLILTQGTEVLQKWTWKLTDYVHNLLELNRFLSGVKNYVSQDLNKRILLLSFKPPRILIGTKVPL